MVEKINLGQYKICEKWEDVTLKQWENYMRKTAENENNKVDLISILEIFSNIPRNIINQLPSELFEKILTKMTFLRDDVSEIEPTNKLTINGETYIINTMEKLKTKEYLDITTILDNDKFNYSAIFAVLCRKENEIYDEDFSADKLEERIEMFQNIQALEGLRLIGFFLNCWEILNQHLINSLITKGIKEDTIKLVKSIENLRSPMDYIIPSRVRQIFRLRKLKKSLKAI